MIRNTVIHITNEQPLVADLYDMPTSADVSLVCTNIRMLDGKKPVFIDHATSVFVFPYVTIRFLEIPAAAATGSTGTNDEPAEREPIVVARAGGDHGDGAGEAGDVDLELDEDFLRRIREV